MRLILLALVTSLCLFLSGAPARAALEDCAGDLVPSNPSNRIVELLTTLGSICIELLEDQAPLTTANFLAYLERGDYDGIFFHRAIDGFIVQGGGFRASGGSGTITAVPKDPEVDNEPCTLDEPVPGQPGLMRCSQRGNVRGTLAMAKRADPLCTANPGNCVPRPDYVDTHLPRAEFVNSATNEWFINLADNRANLDNQNGGFTVFARVLGDGVAIADVIAALPHQTHPSSSLVADPMTLLPIFVSLPVQALAAEPPGGFGCFDIGDLSVLFNQFGNDFETDDTHPSGLAVLSGACGTLLPSLQDFVPNASQNPACPIVDRLGEGAVERPSDGALLPRNPRVFFSFTCDEVEESQARLDDRRAAMSPLVMAQTIRIDEVIDLPEPSQGLLGATALVAVAALARRRRAARSPIGARPRQR
jgi:cyclophilin family peptidyl-prolyl cis-trans isomerase